MFFLITETLKTVVIPETSKLLVLIVFQQSLYFQKKNNS